MANNFLKELGKKEVIVPHLNRWFRNGEFPYSILFEIKLHKEEDDAFHPSSDATACARLLYAKRMDDVTKRELEGNTYKTFFFGHYFHGLLQHVLVEELGFADQFDVEKQYRIYRRDDGIYKPKDWWIDTQLDKSSKWWARGYADIARVVVPGREEPYLVDIKTMKSSDYRQSVLPVHLEEKYITQIQLYMDWEDIENGIILCCEKDSPHGFKEFAVKRNKELVKSVYTKWDIVIDAISKGEPPACTCLDESKCPAKDLYIESISNSHD